MKYLAKNQTASVFFLISLILGLAFQNCAPVGFKVEGSNDAPSEAPQEDTDVVATAVQADCSFDGKRVAHGASIDSFLSSSVAYGESCKTEKRICDNGVLSGTFEYATCGVGSPAACLFNGKTILHGASTPAFVTSNVAYGQSCQSESRVCNNGTLSGTASYASCAPAAPASCLFNGKTIAHGASENAFAATQVPQGSSCQMESRVCNNGNLSGSFTYSSCAQISVCGSANGAVDFEKPSSSELCNYGIASSISGDGTTNNQWRWTCNYSGQIHQCAQAVCSKISIKVRSSDANTLNEPFKNLSMNQFTTQINNTLVTIGSPDSPPINSYITSYEQFASVMQDAYAADSFAKDLITASVGSTFYFRSSDGTIDLPGKEIILQAKPGSGASFQSGGGWSFNGGSSASAGSFGTSVSCKP